MSKVSRGRLFGLLVVLILAVVILPAAAGQARHSPPSHAQGRFASAADTTFRQGVHSKLPPHISTLLGISKEEVTPVMQGVLRTSNQVQGIDVSVANKNEIVLFVVDETTAAQDFYLTSPAGALRRVVSVRAGVGNVIRITEKEKIAFEKEKHFWVDRLLPPIPAK